MSLGENASQGSKLRREVAGHSFVKHIKQMGASWTNCGGENLPPPLSHANEKAAVKASPSLRLAALMSERRLQACFGRSEKLGSNALGEVSVYRALGNSPVHSGVSRGALK